MTTEDQQDQQDKGAVERHPGVEALLPVLANLGVTGGSIQDQRDAMAQAATPGSTPEGVTVAPGTLGGRPAEWLTPVGPAPVGTILYLHGGGYCIGSLDTHRDLGARLAVAAGATVVTLDYRLAPEHPFPAAVDDACAAYAELSAEGSGAGRLAVAGDSAGGGLTVATLLALRASGSPLPAAAACLSPWVDLTQQAPSYTTMAELDPMVTKVGLDVMADAYLAGADPTDPLASPLFAPDLTGLPPILIEVGEHEVLLDDAVRLAERLEADGGTVSLTVWPRLIHVFQAFPGSLIPEADQSIAAVGSFLAARLGAGD
jgi:acetyl esterase/lipase